MAHRESVMRALAELEGTNGALKELFLGKIPVAAKREMRNRDWFHAEW
jgi:hypothetical protein